MRVVTAEECQGLAIGRMHWGIAAATHTLPTARLATQPFNRRNAEGRAGVSSYEGL